MEFAKERITFSFYIINIKMMFAALIELRNKES